MLRHKPLLILLLGVPLVAGCNAELPPPPPPKPPDVTVAAAVEEEVTDYEEFQGKTQAMKDVEVRAHVTGYLEKFNFKEGADVHENEVLFEIDPRPFQAELDRAEANVAQAEAHVQRLELDFGRAKRLLPGGSMSREEYDKASGDLTEARSGVKSAVAARNMARLNLDYSRVTAPVSGRISRRYVDPGNMVKADETPLTRIVSLDPIYAYFDIDERTHLRIQRFLEKERSRSGEPAKVQVVMGLSDEKDTFPHEGYVDFVDNRVDPDSGSVWLRGVFANPDKLLTPGLFVRVRLPIGHPHKAVLIPEQALATDQGQKHVWVVSSEKDEAGYSKATYRQLEQFGAQHGPRRVVEKGIQPGELVIVSGLQRVRIDRDKGYAPVKVEDRKPEKVAAK
jgi:multidrug efflux system membrane fusion protein